MSASLHFLVDSFEITESPAGRLASFEAPDELARALGAGSKTTAYATASGPDLVARLAGSRIALVGAGEVAREWAREGKPCFVCAFHPALAGGAAAFELRWA